MKFIPETVSSFFGHQRIEYSIPAYQRAYSWEELQTKTFLDDLLEHKNNSESNPYCYGNILLEAISEGKKYEIIDGQQRITTLSIFIRALLNTFSERIKMGTNLLNSDGDPINVEAEEDIYFKDHGIVRLRPTPYDQACFDTIIVDNYDDFNCITPSQERMLNAKKYFSEELKKLSNEDLISIFETVQNAIVNHIELTGKKESALMFELQNNRGKELTNLEKLKSFLMYQLYVHSNSDETSSNIDMVTNYFNPIYNIVNQMSLQIVSNDEENINDSVNEDSILIYHSYAYSRKNFSYRNINDIIEEYKAIPINEKVSWIINYSKELYSSFTSIQNVLAMNDIYLDKLKKMKMPFFVYPFIIKGCKNSDSLPKLFKLLEVLSFRYKLIGSRADIRGRLNELIRGFNGDVDALSKAMKDKMEEAYYWGDKKFLEILNGNMFQNSMRYYLFWEYERFLQIKGYEINGNVTIKDESIEHISPQTEPDEKVATGYQIDQNGFYSQEYRENNINRLGNLMLMSQPHNSSVGNKPFAEKLESYKKNPLLRQHIKIADYVEDESNPVWDATTIEKRHSDIISFAKERWAFI